MSPTGAENGHSSSVAPEGRERSYVTVQSAKVDASEPSPVVVLNCTERKVIFAFRGLMMYSSPAASCADWLLRLATRPSPGPGTTLPEVPASTNLIDPATCF